MKPHPTSGSFETEATNVRMLDMRRIRQFVVLAETLNFRRAAERLHMAQPPLSVAIQKLENDIGVRLFERGGSGGVSLTPSGSAALAQARRLLFHNTQFQEAATAAAAGMGGALRVGFVGSTTHGALQRIVRLFRADYPGVSLILKEGTSLFIMERVCSGDLDVGIVRTPLMCSFQATLTPLLSEDFVVALPRGNPLTSRAELRLEELANESFVFYSRNEAAGLHAMAMLACQLAGFLPNVTQEATQVQTILALVESGLGVALVPSIMRETHHPRIEYRSLTDTPHPAAIGLALAIRTDRAIPAAHRFREVALQALRA